MKPGADESIDDYLARLTCKAHDTNIPNDLIEVIALQGLHPAISRIVVPQLPANMEDLRHKALLADQTIKVTPLPK